MYFKGDIIITDPCYLGLPSWEAYHGKNIPELSQYICLHTGVGDWSCSTYKTDVGRTHPEKIGVFAADSGMVCVVYRDEVLKHNPHFETNKVGHEMTPYSPYYESIYNRCATLIEDYDGEIEATVPAHGTPISIVGVGNIHFFSEKN